MTGNRIRRILIILLGGGTGIQLIFIFRIFFGLMISKYGVDWELIRQGSLQEIQETIFNEGLDFDTDEIYLEELKISIKTVDNETITVKTMDGNSGKVTVWEMKPSDMLFSLKDDTDVISK